MIEKPKWKGNDMEEQDAADTLIPDLVSIPQIDGTDYFLIFDAKYYNIQLEKHRQRGIVFNPILKNTGRSNLIAPHF